jgi:hypothetical protein
MLNFAAVKAVPENAYRSQMIVVPERKVVWISALEKLKLNKYQDDAKIAVRSTIKLFLTSFPNGWQRIVSESHDHPVPKFDKDRN